jgi:hypothetical protein
MFLDRVFFELDIAKRPSQDYFTFQQTVNEFKVISIFYIRFRFRIEFLF